MLEFEVNGQRLRIKGNLYVVAESIDYLKARFSFSADWDGVIKTAIFKTADRKSVYHVILDENGICTVPSEVIHAPMFRVSVFGGSRITANEVEVLCDVSGYAEGSAPDEPTPEVYEQIIAEINKKVSKVEGMGLSENSYTTEEKTKLGSIAEGAEVNVQSDWNQTDTNADDYIKNKPTSLPASDVYDWAKQSEKPTYTAAEVGALSSDTLIPSYGVATQTEDGLMSAADKAKLDVLSEDGSGGTTEPSITTAVMTSSSFTTSGSNIYETITTDITIEQDTKKYYQFIDSCGAVESIGAGALYAEYTIGGVDLVAMLSDSGEIGGITLESVVPTILDGGDSALHWSCSTWEIIAVSEINVDLTERVTSLENRVSALEAAVYAANDTLAAMLSEGV